MGHQVQEEPIAATSLSLSPYYLCFAAKLMEQIFIKHILY